VPSHWIKDLKRLQKEEEVKDLFGRNPSEVRKKSKKRHENQIVDYDDGF